MHFVNYQQDDWSKNLAMTKFIANNNELTFTKLFSLFATKSFHLHMSFDIVDLSITSTCEQILK